MRRIFGDYAYSDDPRSTCWWNETCEMPAGDGDSPPDRVDVAIIGGGFTGLSAALRLAEEGTSVALFEAITLGWGASGRNGGFCCLGGSKAGDAELDARYGKDARLEYRRGEKAAVEHVAALIEQLDLDVDRHSNGETELAHRPKDMLALRRSAAAVRENYGVEAEVIEKPELERHGMNGGPFFGALSIPIGFGLNPRKYLAGLLKEARRRGARLFERMPVTRLDQDALGHLLQIAGGKVRADHVLIATNGYSCEDMPPWLAARYMPAQSNVLVTRPLSEEELAAQGWTTDQASYDTRNLLHYFRLMPDRRFLFGMRGTLLSSPTAEVRAQRKMRAEFEAMFPAWAHVESPYMWSGLVSLARNKLPYVGPVPKMESVWTAMCYHGNGVAMGSFSGTLAAEMILGRPADACPRIMRNALAQFPLGAARRALMPPLYAKLLIEDSC